jgi:hypothetical protein
MKSPGKLFLDLAYGRKRDALEDLRGRVGTAVQRKAFIRQLGACFPEVVEHPRFAAGADEVLAAAASIFGLEPWGDDWYAVREQHRDLDWNSRSMSAPKARADRREKPKPRDARHRPDWWSRLRSLDEGGPPRLRRLSADDRARLDWYLGPLEEHLASVEELTTDVWSWSGFDSRLSDEDRLRTHSSLIERRVRAMAKKKGVAGEAPSLYADTLKLAFLLGVGDDVVELRLRNGQAEFIQLRVTPEMRTAYAGFEWNSPIHQECVQHAAQLGLAEPVHISRKTEAAFVWSWDRVSRSTALLLRYRIPMIQVDDFLESALGDPLEALVMPFPSLRAAACGRCGRIHTFDGRSVHRKDRICEDH